ncbi:MAG: S8 family serine peptidase [Bdellovibrionota bacterium]
MTKRIFKVALPLCLFFAGLFVAYKFKGNNQVTSLQPQEFAHVSFVPNSRGPANGGLKKGNRFATILYKLKDNATAAEIVSLQQALQSLDITIEKKHAGNKINQAKSLNPQGKSEEQIAADIFATGAVEFAEADALIDLSMVPNDPYYSSQWHHEKISSPAAWNVTSGIASVIVADCDTGVEATHPDLAARLLLPGYNSEDGSSNFSPVHPHGTMTSGTMAATLNNNGGVAGVAGNVSIIPIKISNRSDGSAYYSAMINCISYAADRGAKVVNLSYDVTDSLAIDSAAQYLRSKGGLLFVAAGNSGADISSRADVESFITVGATDTNDQRTSWSNYGTPVDIVAPGLDILTTTTAGAYAYASGTSFSAPIVAGTAALLYSINPNFTASQIEQFIFNSATKLGNEAYFGNGRVNAAAAVQAAGGNVVPQPAPTPAPVTTTTTTTTVPPKPGKGRKK